MCVTTEEEAQRTKNAGMPNCVCARMPSRCIGGLPRAAEVAALLWLCLHCLHTVYEGACQLLLLSLGLWLGQLPGTLANLHLEARTSPGAAALREQDMQHLTVH